MLFGVTDTVPGTQTDHTLVLLRHGKAVPDAATDLARPLADRGHADAAAVGEWLRAHRLRFGLVLCSPSERTRQTWAGIAASGVEAADVWMDRRVYNADVEDLIDALADVSDDVESVLVVGHAPSIPALAETLADPDTSDPEALDELADKFPTSCLAVLSFSGRWSELDPASAVLTDVAAPRG
jgi:phosphohistidine phosphatase